MCLINSPLERASVSWLVDSGVSGAMLEESGVS